MFFLVTIIGIIGSIVLGLIVLSKDKKNPLHVLFFLFAIFLGLYNFWNYFFWDLTNDITFRLAITEGALLTSSAVAWIHSLCKGYKLRDVGIIYGLGIISGLLAIPDNFYLQSITQIPESGYIAIAKPAFFIHIIFTVSVSLYGAILIIYTTIKEKGLVKRKLSYIVLGLFTFYVTTLLVDIVLPALGLGEHQIITTTSSIFFLVFLSYVMIKFKKAH